MANLRKKLFEYYDINQFWILDLYYKNRSDQYTFNTGLN